MTPAEFIQRLQKVSRTSHGWQARCPAHEDNHPSLSVSQGTDGRILLRCHRGCSVEAICEAIGIRTADLFCERPTSPLGTVEAVYPYRDEAGQILYEVVRFKPKAFRQRIPKPDGSYQWHLNGVRRVLYRLPELRAYDGNGWIFIVEGEKDVESLVERGLVATCNVGGAGKWKGKYNDCLNGRFVAIIPDNDESGHKHAEQVAQSLYGKADRIRLVPLPAGKDVTDYLAVGNSADDLLRQVDATPEWMPSVKSEEPVIEAGESEPNTDQTRIIPPRLFRRTDSGTAMMLAQVFGNRFRFHRNRGCWLVFDGKRWDADRGDSEVRVAMTRLARMLREDALQDEEHRDLIEDYARSLENHGKKSNVLAEAQHIPPFSAGAGDFDANPWLLNTESGTVDLRTGHLHPHNPEDMLTFLAPVSVDPQATCERFDRFLLEIMDDNAAMVQFLLRLLGMCLTGDVREQILPIFWGQGANGKSVLLDTIRRILGDYACNGAPDLLIRKRGESHPTEIADLQGRRLVICAENERNAALRIQFIKLLTGDDVLKARYMRQDFFSFKRTHKTILVTNNRPAVDEDTHAVWRRLRLVQFIRIFTGNECDPHLLDTLWAERSGILNRLIQGCLAWQRDGLSEPAEVLAATAEYRKSQSPLEDFLAERIVADPTRYVPVAEMAAVYSQWCEEHDATPVSPRQFNTEMRQRGYVYEAVYHEGKTVKVWLGVSLKLTDFLTTLPVLTGNSG